jgi:hypothetical protein
MRQLFQSSLLALALFAVACSSGGGGSQRTFNGPATGPANQSQIALGSAAGTSTITIPVELNNRGTAAPSALQFDVAYDTSRLQIAAVRIAGNAVTANKDITVHTSAAQQKSRVIIFGMNDTPLTNGVVAEIDFAVTGGAGNVPLTISKTMITAGDSSLVASNGASGNATIQ